MSVNGNGWNSDYNDQVGRLLVGDGTRPKNFSVGADFTILQADSAQAQGVKWGGTSTTWTPTVTFGGLAVGVTYSLQSGNYIQIGNCVFFNFRMTLTSKGTSVGVARIEGFPVASGPAGDENSMTIDQPSSTNLDAGNLYSILQLENSATTARLFQLNINGVSTSLADTNFTDTSRISVSGKYFLT